MIINNVCVVKYSVLSDKEVYREELGTMSLEDLGAKLKGGAIKFPTVNTWEQSYIQYECGAKHYITIEDKTSDVSSEWFKYEPSEDIIQRSVTDQQDYSRPYTDYLLLNEGKELMTQTQWVESERAKRKSA